MSKNNELQSGYDALSEFFARERAKNVDRLRDWNADNPPAHEIEVEDQDSFTGLTTYGVWPGEDCVGYCIKDKNGYNPNKMIILHKNVVLAMYKVLPVL